MAEGQIRASRLIQTIGGDEMALTDEQVDAYYRGAYVEPEREKYENDLSLFDRDSQVLGITTYYIPAGYRRIAAIIMPPPEDIAKPMAELNAQREQATRERDDAWLVLGDAEATDVEQTDAQSTYEVANTQLERLYADEQRLQEEMLSALSGKTSEILAQYRDGATFDALIPEYGVNELPQGGGYLVREKATIWPAAFRRTAMGLKQVGDISAPFATQDGVYILQYRQDVNEGARRLTLAENDALKQEATITAKMNMLQEFVREQASKYTIVTHPELLDYAQ